MTVSVIIPTFNGKHKIGTVLQALAKQTFKNIEVLVVIDGSTDGTEAYLNSQDFGISFTTYVQHNKGRAAVRNKGADLASGSLLIFFDDDMRPLPNCIEEHINHHKKFRGSLMSGAQIDDYQNATTDFLQYKCWLSRKWASNLTCFEDQSLPLTKLHLTAANFSIEKDVFYSLGGFDSQLKDAEDFDLAIRAYLAGRSIYYNHKAFAWHDDIVTVRSYINRLREYRSAHLTLREFKPKIYKDLPLRKPTKQKGLRRMISNFFAHQVWTKLVEMDTLKVFPEFLRYKIYDLVTTSYGTVFTERDV